MKARELIRILSAVDPEKEVVFQRDYRDGGFTLYDICVTESGHIGHSGPILYMSHEFEHEAEKSPLQEVRGSGSEG